MYQRLLGSKGMGLYFFFLRIYTSRRCSALSYKLP